MNLGFIGFGNHVAKTTLDIFKKNKLFNLKCFYILNEKKGKRIEDKQGILFIKEIDKFLDQNIDIIYINVPPEQHYKYIKICIQNKKNVICEKPITLSYKDAIYLFKLAKMNNVFLFEVCQYVFHNHFNKIKKLISDDLLLNQKSRRRFFYASFKLPMQEIKNFRVSSKFNEIIKYDLGYYTVNILQRFFTEIKFTKSKNITYSKKDFYKNVSFNAKELNGIIEWGIGFQYSNQISYFSDTLFFETEQVFSKPKKYIPIINIIKNKKLKKIPMKEESHFKNMFETYIKIIKNKNFKKYEFIKLNTINTLKLLNKI